MASSEEYKNFIAEQFSGLDGITYRPMMREYIFYFKGKVFGGIYDNRFLVKGVKSAAELMPDSPLEIPYPGGKPMLLVENVDDTDFLKNLVLAMYDELPEKAK